MSVLQGTDSRFLTEEHRARLLDGLKGQPGVSELSDHIAALEERVMLTSQYYEEFLIPKIERGGFEQMVARDRKGPVRRTPG